MASQLELNEIQAIYEDVLFREPDPAGQAFWAGVLDAGLQNLQQIVAALATSPEALNNVDPIIRLYDGLFGRSPDYAGLKGWVALADGGTSFGTIVQDFVQSQEFANDYNGGVLAPIPGINGAFFIDALYNHSLGRAPDAAGLAHWLSVLGSTPTVASEAAVIEGIVTSPEYIADTQNGILAWQAAGAAAALAGTTDSVVGTPTYPDAIVNTALTRNLTSGPDQIESGVTVSGDLTDSNGVTPTLNSGDVIANVTNLVLTDAFGNGADILPVGADLSNIWHIVLTTAGNAGDFYRTGAWFDTSGVSNLLNVAVVSQGAGVDMVQAAATTNVNVTHNNSGGGVEVIGGDDVTVANNGGWGVVVGSSGGGEPVHSAVPAGDVTVTQNSSLDGDVQIYGGHDVTVTVTSDSYGGDIDIGNTDDNTSDVFSGGFTDPTGAIVVNDDAEYGGDITVFGGTSVTITAAGEAIQVGDPHNRAITGANNPSGDVTVTDTAPRVWGDPQFGGQEEDVLISGGADINVTTNTGDVSIGDYDSLLNATGTAALAGTQPTGDVTVTDTATENNGDVYAAFVRIFGGDNVNVTADGANIEVGAIAGDPVVLAPTGDVTITDLAAVAYGTAEDTVPSHVYVIGGHDIDITANVSEIAVGSDYLNSMGTAALAGENPSGTVTIIDTATTGGISVEGGTDVHVTAAGDEINIGTVEDGVVIAPSGDINVSNLAAIAYDGIVNQSYEGVDVTGGVDVTVTTNAGGVFIGDWDHPVSGENPSGDVMVTDTATGLWVNPSFQTTSETPDVEIYGGRDVTVTVDDATVYIGNGTADTNPTADVSVTVTGFQTANQYDNTIFVGGGDNVTIVTTGAANYSVDIPAIEVGTATTLDSGVVVPGSPVTGEVAITDTHSGWNYSREDITVLGGAQGDEGDAVYISAGLLSSGSTITVGAEPMTNGPGTAFVNLGDDPTSGTVYLSQTDGLGNYGEADNDVYVNGATAVSVNGGYDATVTDVESLTIPSGPDAGDLVGNSTLTTVDLTGLQNEAWITANALTNLNLAENPVGDDPAVFIQNTRDSTGLTIGLSNEDAFVEDVGGHIGGTLTINAAGGPPNDLSLNFNKATTLAFNLDADAVLGLGESDLDAVTSITATGGAASLLNLGDLSGESSGQPFSNDAPDLTSVTVSGGVSVFVDIDPTRTSFAGNGSAGAGNNEVVIDNNVPTAGPGVPTVDGGAGANNIIYAAFNGGADFSGLTDAVTLNVTNFETLGVVSADGVYNASGYTKGLVVGIYDYYHQEYDGVPGNIGFTNVGANVPLTFLAGGDVTYSLAAKPTNPGTVSVQVGQDADLPAGVVGTEGVVAHVHIEVGTGTSDANIGEVDMDSQGNLVPGDYNVVYLDEVNATHDITTLVITGDEDISVYETQGSVTTVDASGASGAVDLHNVTFNDATVTGGTGLLTADFDGPGSDSSDQDTFNIGTGGGDITLGAGGAGGGVIPFETVTGDEIVNLTASAVGTTISTLTAPSTAGGESAYGTQAIVHGYRFGTVTNGGTAAAGTATGTADVIVFQSSPDVLANGTFTAAGANFTVSDGVISLTGGTTPTDAVQLTDAVTYLDAQAALGHGNLAMIHVTAGTYLIESNGGGGAADTIVELAGVSGATGFGLADSIDPTSAFDIGGGTSVMVSDGNPLPNFTGFFQHVTANAGAGNGGTVGGSTYDDTGYSLDTLNVSAGTNTNTYNNLGNYALLEANESLAPSTPTGPIASGNVTVTQVGVDPILTFVANDDVTLTNLTYGNGAITDDNPTLVLAAEGGNISLTTLTDASNSGTTLGILDFGTHHSVSIGSISDTALTDIDASTFTGALALGTELTPLTETGLTIDVATAVPQEGDVAIFASGDGDTIAVGGAEGADANVVIQAAGEADSIYVTSDDSEGPGAIVGAAGAGDHLTLIGGEGFNPSFLQTLAGTVDGVIAAAGNKDSAYDIAHDTLINGVDTAAGPPSVNDTPLGAGDTLQIGDPTGDEPDTTVIAWLGLNSHVTIDQVVDAPVPNTVADLWVTGDFTGAGASAATTNDLVGTTALGHEEIQWNAGNLNLYFFNEAHEGLAGGNWLQSVVNVGVASVMSLGGALDLAASEVTTLAANFNNSIGIIVPTGGPAEIQAGYGLIDWFQYDGNTYIVEANNGTTVHGSTATPAAEAHTALGTHDVVIELIGLVNPSDININHYTVV
jgi:hypothetical protein